MDKEVAMIISALIGNVGKMDDIEASAKRTVEAVEILKKTWSTPGSLEEDQFNSIVEALKKVYNIHDMDEDEYIKII